ncbi:lincomycin resistance protein LmrB [Paenibacillus sp. J31TS4]|uniref:DHA2 family efflux MFS transporter permease subunit n=1 Tax=Paenibacillus sp. J31TS4 TaxID=2807195 RepID=UPI001B11AD8C|nr:DHA2 family efflux MFS transporter permease subunit [Paenibacillus sp. J31TS4]GIP41410.1 lincomycin resistance protein LmrB [Paenibacillus sp. J31TS4]
MKKEIKTGPIMAALLVAGFVGLFSETALNIALEALSRLFEVDSTTIQWLATGYFLTLGILVPVTGILMQKFTTRQMFLASLFLSIGGTVLAALAPVFGVLLAARVIQAAGLAIILPLTQNVIFTIYPPHKRGAAMGIMGLVILAGPAFGPTLAGMILDTLSWHWIFWFTLPFLLFSVLLGARYLPNVNEVQKVLIDVRSVALSTIGFGGVVYGVSVGGDHGWTSVAVWGCVLVGLLALLAFSIRQTKLEHPMLNLKAFRFPMFSLGLIMNMITFLNMLSMLVVLPLYMRTAMLVSAFVTGLLMLPGSLLNCVLAPVIGRLFDTYGPRAVITPGTILVVLGYGLYAVYGTEPALWLLAATHIVMMLGIGMVLASVQTNTLNALPREYYPDGIAITQTSQQVAGAIGIAVMVSLFSAKRAGYLSGTAGELPAAAAAGSSFVFTISLVLAIVNVGLSLWMKRPQPAPSNQSAPRKAAYVEGKQA